MSNALLCDGELNPHCSYNLHIVMNILSLNILSQPQFLAQENGSVLLRELWRPVLRWHLKVSGSEVYY